ncbi:Lipopolysaccharide export system ATP-binding protein LptB [Myxococcaceae bacterium]|jgi:branched-chain amino acid transport system ATP-binding protein|nr:Lipopolysaccharide export system ATP-binding protein LptB [Myxococcaceae bacterium]
MALLELRRVTMRFGGLTSVSDLDLDVDPGQVVALIGPNGAGKTTAFNVVTGVYAPTEGSIRFAGREIAGRRPHEISRLGVARTFQNIRLFRGLTAAENVRVALAAAKRSGLFDVLRPGSWRRQETTLCAEAVGLLERLGLSHVADTAAGSLPYGDQRLLEIARALATRPRLLLLDEPAAGMNPSEKQDLGALVARLRAEFGLAIVLIEHDVRFVMDLAERVSVLDHGEKIAEGPPEAVRRDPAVIEAYLGAPDAGGAPA